MRGWRRQVAADPDTDGAAPIELPTRRRITAPQSDGASSRLRVEDLAGEGVHVLLLHGELSVESVEVLENVVSGLGAGAGALILDMRGLTFIDSSGLWTITSLHKWCTREGVGLTLVRGPGQVHRVFEVTGLSDVLPFSRPAAKER